MRLVNRTLDKLVLENRAPRYRGFLGAFLVSFPVLLLAYAIVAQRNYLDCARNIINQVNCQYVQEKKFPIASEERFPLTDVKLTRVYQEVFVSVDGERTVQNNVLVLGKNNYLYIENFHDIDSASDFKSRLEQFFQIDRGNVATISQHNLDIFWKLLRDPANSPYYLWGLLCLVAGATFLYDTAKREIYILDTRSGLFTRRRRGLLFRGETDYLLEKIVAVRIDTRKDLLGCTSPRVLLILSTGEEIGLNARPIDTIGNGFPERAIVAAIEQHLNRKAEEVVV
jgi:hypothetical protein